MKTTLDFNKLNWLIPAIIQDSKTQEILMLWFMNEESFDLSLNTWKVRFFSRTRNELWLKWETSGNFLIITEILSDCDNDTLLIKAQQIWSSTCHTWAKTCFNNWIIF